MCHNYTGDILPNTLILQCILKDKNFRENFHIKGDRIDRLNVIQQPADTLVHECLTQMMKIGVVQHQDICQYRSNMKCRRCQNTHAQEHDNIISVPHSENDVTKYIDGFPHTSAMEGVNQVYCDTCGSATNHTKKEDLCGSNSFILVLVLCCNRDPHHGEDNIYKNLNIPEFLQLEEKGINTHQIVGATIHKPGHFIALRKFERTWFKCDDNRIKELSKMKK